MRGSATLLSDEASAHHRRSVQTFRAFLSLLEVKSYGRTEIFDNGVTTRKTYEIPISFTQSGIIYTKRRVLYGNAGVEVAIFGADSGNIREFAVKIYNRRVNPAQQHEWKNVERLSRLDDVVPARAIKIAQESHARCIAMEPLDGDLTDFGGKLETSKAIEVVSLMLDDLKYVYQHTRLIFTDLKIANFLYKKSHDFVSIHVVDWAELWPIGQTFSDPFSKHATYRREDDAISNVDHMAFCLGIAIIQLSNVLTSQERKAVTDELKACSSTSIHEQANPHHTTTNYGRFLRKLDARSREIVEKLIRSNSSQPFTDINAIVI